MTPEKLKYKQYLERIGEETVMPAIELVVLLCTTYGTTPDVEVEAVMWWRSAYLEVYDNQDSYMSVNDIKDRREIIEDTFDKLAKIVSE
jgi:hypothetical protein